LQNKGVV